jgi:hypothetical protein
MMKLVNWRIRESVNLQAGARPCGRTTALPGSRAAIHQLTDAPTPA